MSADRSRNTSGFVTVQYVFATAAALFAVVLLTNSLINMYVRAAVRDSIDDGVRAAIAHGADVNVCQQRVDGAVAGLLHGAYRRGVRAQCSVVNGVVHADAQLHLPSFLPSLLPSWSLQLHAVARQEPL